MAGDVRVTMALAPKKVQGSIFGLPFTLDVMSGRGMADHPDDNHDISASFEFMCRSGLGLHSTVYADSTPAEAGAPPTGQVYRVGLIEIQSVTSTRIVAALKPVQAPVNRPNPFDAQVQIEFVRPPV
jgi:hypothetical protein